MVLHEEGGGGGGELVVGERRVSGDSPLLVAVATEALSHVLRRQVVAVVTTADVTLAVIPV